MKPSVLVVLVLVCASASGAVRFGQTPAYEVASIRPSAPEPTADGPIRWSPGGRFTATRAKLKEVIQLAYQVEDFQISGLPDWTGSERYDIVAVPNQEVSFNPAAAGTLYSMLQRLLEDRLHLKFHREKKQMQIYALVVGKSGPKLQRSHAADGTNWQIDQWAKPRQLVGANVAPDVLTKTLTQELNRNVVDKTGLKGYFDFTLMWSPEATTDGPTIFTAIQEQLGLRLESQRGAVEVLIIDHVERPTANQ